jgi:MerR family transcriptional regulator, light-induced transcriptional regulator
VPNVPQVQQLDDGPAIQQVSLMLGVPAPTLRSWERRYGVPTTPRSPGGHRRYSDSALHELRLMRDEVAQGRPAADAARRVRMLVDDRGPGALLVEQLLDASMKLDQPSMHGVLGLAESELGLAAALDEVLLPAMRQIGNWWASGRCDVGQEHAATAAVRSWMTRRTGQNLPSGTRPVVLACGPRDHHTVGLEALALLLAERGRPTHMLGARTPAEAVVSCVQRTDASAVVLVSQLPTHRRVTAQAVQLVAETGCPTYYAGNAFLFHSSRRGVAGTYLGESLADAAEALRSTG